MASIMKIQDGVVYGVYDDRLRPILEALGTMEITRATRVEFEPVSQLWVATYIPTGEVIARGPNRSQVIREEVAWLETNVINKIGAARE